MVAEINLPRLFMMQLDVLGSSMGTAGELAALMDLLVQRDVRPVVDSVLGFSQVREALARLERGDVFGKIVLDHAR
jgi:D-arabinose 1-dehydrogenase-like Zn-dependent alcohol dehydrogenase